MSHIKVIAVDTETKDPHLKKLGPGFLRGDAEIKGFSVAAEHGQWFFPLAYPEDNYHDPAEAVAWLGNLLANPETTVVFHNAAYDLEVLQSIGISVCGRVFDTMVNECLIDENSGSFGLDASAARRDIPGKDKTLLLEAAAAHKIRKSDIVGEMWRLPARYVGPYAQQDARATFDLFAWQHGEIERQHLQRAVELESKLIPITHAMRQQGVAVDLEAAHGLGIQWEEELKETLRDINFYAGRDLYINSPTELANYCRSRGYDFPVTEDGNPSFQAPWLKAHGDQALKRIARARTLEKMNRDFIQGQIFKYQIDGRLHAQYHTTRRDAGGTKSGRFAASNPGLQLVPARDPDFGPAIRRLYRPDGGMHWGKFDYSSQEPRITLHFAGVRRCKGANEFIEKYRVDKAFDQHALAAQALGFERGTVKAINLGLTYGMELPTLAETLGVTVVEADVLRNKFNHRFPFIQKIASQYKAAAKRQGYVSTILGRRAHWGANSWDFYKALNRAVQGSGADMVKQAIVDVYRETGDVPLITVHDENNYNVVDESHARTIEGLMENAIELSVPAYVEGDIMQSWGGKLNAM